MNQASKDITKTAFSLAYDSATRFDEKVKSTFARYKSEKEKAKERATAFKDEKSEYARLMEGPTATARAELKEADQEFSDTLKSTVIPRLREVLADYVTGQPPKAFLDTVRIYREFGLKPTKMELQTLLHASEGNYLGMRTLQKLAQETGYDIKFSDVATYEKDIENLEKLARVPSCYGPLAFSKEVDEIFPEVPVFGVDGGIAYYQAASPLRAILNAQEFTSGYKKIQEAQERWTTAIIPELTAYLPVENEDGETISPYEQRQEDIDEAAQVADVDNDPALYGKKLGEMRANQARESAKILEHYGAGNHIE